MYRLDFCIDTDSDFSYTRSEYEVNADETNTVYFSSYEDAYEALIDVISSACHTLPESFKDSSFYELLDSILNDLHLLNVNDEEPIDIDDFSGNQSIKVVLNKCKLVQYNKGFAYPYCTDDEE